MSRKANTPTSIGNAVKKAIRHLGESEGSSFARIKTFLSSLYQSNADIPDPVAIRNYLKNAVDKGVLSKLNNGKYKINETARRRRSRSRSRSRGKSRRRSKSRKRSGGRRRKRSRSGGRRRRRSSSGRRRKRSGSGRRRRRRRSKAHDEEE